MTANSLLKPERCSIFRVISCHSIGHFGAQRRRARGTSQKPGFSGSDQDGTPQTPGSLGHVHYRMPKNPVSIPKISLLRADHSPRFPGTGLWFMRVHLRAASC
jgi:hypothetical protein